MSIGHKFSNVHFKEFSDGGFYTENGILKNAIYKPETLIVGIFNPEEPNGHPEDFFHGDDYFWPAFTQLRSPYHRYDHEQRVLSKNEKDDQPSPSLKSILKQCLFSSLTFADLISKVLNTDQPEYTRLGTGRVNYRGKTFNLNQVESDNETFGLQELHNQNQVEWNTENIIAYLIDNPQIKSIFFTGALVGIFEEKWNELANHELLKDRAFTPILSPTERAISSLPSPYKSNLKTLKHYWIYNGLPHRTPVNNPSFGRIDHKWLENCRIDLEKIDKFELSEELYEKQNLSFSLHSGRIVRLEGFYFGITYSGLFQGIVNDELNEEFFEELSYPKNWGERKVLKIRPEDSEFSTILKPYYCAVWLSSDPIVDGDSSELVIIWLTDQNDLPILDLIRDGVKGFDWNQEAEDGWL